GSWRRVERVELQVLVRVNDAGHDGHTFGVDNVRAFRYIDIFCSAYFRYSLPVDDDSVVKLGRRTGGIDDRPADNRYWVSGLKWRLRGPERRHGIGCSAQRC